MADDVREMLPEDQRVHYDAILAEIEPLVLAESYAQAIARMDMIIQAIPVTQESRLLRAAMLAKRGELHLDEERYEDAEEDVRHALHNGMRSPSVYALAGWIQLYMDEPDQARGHFDRVLEQAPEDTSALMGRAMVLQELNEPELARADLTQGIEVDPGNASLYALRAEVDLKLGDVDQAERDLRKAVGADDTEPEYALALARVRAVRGIIDEALELTERALRQQEEPSLEALLLRSYLRLANGKLEGARSDAMSASNKFPDEAFALVQLARVQLTQGNTSMALKAAERAVKLDPSLPDAYAVRGAARQLEGDAAGGAEDMKRAERAPAELPLFLFGGAVEALGVDALHDEVVGRYDEANAPSQPPPRGFPGMPSGLGGMGGFPGMGGMGMDPSQMMGMLSQVFDDEGNIRPMFKPMMNMVLKNAPSLLKNMPKSMLKNVGGVDPEMLDQFDVENLSAEALEAQMKQFYKMMKSGQDPMEMVRKAQSELDKQNKGD
ncbi:MAG: tetratricopeptide repeat protein [Myxococcota bacterium]